MRPADITCNSAYRLTAAKRQSPFLELPSYKSSFLLLPLSLKKQKSQIMSNPSSQLRFDGKVVIVTGAGGMSTSLNPWFKKQKILMWIRWSWKSVCYILWVSWCERCRKWSWWIIQRRGKGNKGCWCCCRRYSPDESELTNLFRNQKSWRESCCRLQLGRWWRQDCRNCCQGLWHCTYPSQQCW